MGWVGWVGRVGWWWWVLLLAVVFMESVVFVGFGRVLGGFGGRSPAFGRRACGMGEGWRREGGGGGGEADDTQPAPGAPLPPAPPRPCHPLPSSTRQRPTRTCSPGLSWNQSCVTLPPMHSMVV